MSITTKTKPHKYLVCAIYRNQLFRNDLTRVEHVGIVLAYSPFSAVKITERGYEKRGYHLGKGEKPSKYVASRILGPFQITPSGRTYTCEELLSRKR